MRTIISISLVLTLLATVAGAQEKIDAAERARQVATFLDEDLLAVARLDLARLELAPLLKDLERQLGGEFKKEFGDALSQIDKLRAGVVGAGAKDAYVVFSLADFPVHGPFGIISTSPKRDLGGLVKAIRGAAGFAPNGAGVTVEPLDDAGNIVFAGNKNTLARVRKNMRSPASRPELAKALETAGDASVQILLLPSDDHRRVVREVLPRFPEQMGGGPTQPVVDGLRFAVLSINLTPKLSARLVVQASDARGAEAQRDILQKLIGMVAEHRQVKKHLPDLREMAKELKARAVEDRVVVEIGEDPKQAAALIAVLARFLRETKADAERRLISNKLRQIGIAMHSHADENKSTLPPPAIYDAKGKPLLSWRVRLLPYLEGEALYKQFRLDEPWDSEHNKKLIAKMPDVFRSASAKLTSEGRTTFVVPVGESTVFRGPKGVSFREITDGTSNTICLLHADDELAVVWTKPEDWSFDAKEPKKALFGARPRMATLFCDASVHIVGADIDAVTFGRLVMRNDGQPVHLP